MASEFVEQALIASFFQGRNKTEVQEQLLDVDPEWLEGAATKPLLAAMRACLLGGEAIIEATILGQLRAAGELGVDSCYWPAFQEVLAFTEPQPIDKLVAEIRDDYLRRQAKASLEDSRREMDDTSIPAEELIAKASDKLASVANCGFLKDDTWGEIFEAIDSGSINDKILRPGARLWTEVNEVYMFPREMVTIYGARPNVGKSIMGLTTIKHTVEWLESTGSSEGAMWVNQDMFKGYCQVKLVSAVSGVPQARLTSGILSRQERDAVAYAKDIIKRRLAFLHFNGGTPMSFMKPKVIQAARRAKAACIIWDQFSQIAGDRTIREEAAKSADISSQLKNLAGTTGAALVVLAQINRNGGDGEPSLTDLAKTDGLVQDAGGVFLLWPNTQRAATAPQDDFNFGKAKTSEQFKNVPYIDMRLAKSQIGPVGEVWHLFRDGERNSFKMDVRLT